MKKIAVLLLSLIGYVSGYGSPPPPPPPPCNTPQCSSGTFCYSSTNRCTTCPAGYKYKSNPNIGVSSIELWGCDICPSGSFSSVSGSSSCTLCPTGKFNSGSGNTKCFDCLTNTYNNKVGQTICLTCSRCDVSEYLVSSCSKTTDTICEPCDIIDKCAVDPICISKGDSICSSCLSEYYLQGSNKCLSTTKCVINKEYEILSYSLTTDRICSLCLDKCPKGEMLDGICSGTSNFKCISCPQEHFKVTSDNSVCLPCISSCSPGFELHNTCSSISNSKCVPCADGFYNSFNDDSKCLPCTSSCEPGFELNHECLTDKNPLCIPCADGFYKSSNDGSKCLPCTSSCEPGFELNHECLTDKNPLCIPCADGFYKSSNDNSKCSPCTSSCEPGFELNHECLMDKNPLCISCLDGFYKSSNDGSKCLKCNTDCGEGSYISDLCVSTFNSKCEYCPVNTANPNHFSIHIESCIPCKDGSTSVVGSATCIQCPLGTATFGGVECMYCTPGTYTDNLGSIECKLCPAGTFSDLFKSESINNCVLCDEGYYSFIGSERCIPCSEGTYENGKRLECISCPVGSYNDEIIQTKCKLCPGGTFNDKLNSVSIDECKKCLPGFYSIHGQSECSMCEAGKYNDEYGSNSCKINLPGTITPREGMLSPIDCLPGTYSDTHGAIKCLLCNQGYMNTIYRSTTIEECMPCLEGTFVNFSGATFCYNTPIGTYQDKIGQNSSILCPPGTYNNQVGSINIDSCIPCEIGTYQPNSGSSECIKCSSGYYQDNIGQLECIHCPVGTYNEEYGSYHLNSCSLCEEGTYSSIVSANTSDMCLISPLGTFVELPGSSKYTECNPGYYQNKTKQTSCIKCPIGTYNPLHNSINSSSCIISPVGSYVPDTGYAQFIPCNLGSYSNITGATKCILCNPGKFTDDFGSTTCKYCPSGKFSLYNGAETCEDIGLPDISVYNITQSSYSVVINTNFTSIIPFSYVCSDKCEIYVNDKLIDQYINVNNKTREILLKIRPGIDVISVLYNKEFNTFNNIRWNCFKKNTNTKCIGIFDNIVILSSLMKTSKNEINTYGNPNTTYSSVITSYSKTQTYYFHLDNLEPYVKYSFKLIFKIVNETFQMDPIIINDIITKVGIPTGPVQGLVKYFIGITPIEHELNEQSKLKIHWEPPLIELQNGPITNYSILYTREQRQYITYGPFPRTIIVPKEEKHIITKLNTIMLENLNPDTHYTIRVYPKTDAIGLGPESIIRLKTSVSAPPKPPTLTLESITDKDIIVSWPSLTNETGEITKIWIVSEPYELSQLTSEVVHISENSSTPFLPFPHEGIKGFFASYNIDNTCESHIHGFTFLSINTKNICGGFCDTLCEYGTEMLDPNTILPTNDKTLVNDNYIMLFNTSDGGLSSRYVPYLTMKKRIDNTTSRGGLDTSGKFLIGDGLNNIKSKLNNTLLNITLNYRFRFMVFTSETLYSISDALDITLSEKQTTITITEGFIIAFVIAFIVIIILFSLLFCYKSLNKNKVTNIADNDNILMTNINENSISNPCYCNPINSAYLDVNSNAINDKNNSVSNPSYWTAVNIKENKSKLLNSINNQITNPIYWTEQNESTTEYKEINYNKSDYLDVYSIKYNQINPINNDYNYIDIDTPPLPEKEREKNKYNTYLEEHDAPPLPDKQNKYINF